MGVNKDMDLFETVHDKLGCEYISDICVAAELC